MTKPNPRRIPRTQQDVDRAYSKGIEIGSENAAVIMLSALLDKFNAGDYIADVWAAFSKYSEEIVEGRLSIADMRYVLRKEYSIEI